MQEVKTAIKTYEMYPHLDAFKEEDLDTVHDKVHDKYPNITDSAWNVLGYLGGAQQRISDRGRRGPCGDTINKEMARPKKRTPKIVIDNYRGAHKQIYLMRNYYIAADA